MSEHELLQNWILSAADKLQLRVTNYTWPQTWKLDYSDVGVEITINNAKHVGRGGAKSPDEALTKALAEATERATMRHHHLESSNGVAAHFSQEAAAENAMAELVERDAFLCHYLTGAQASAVKATDGLDMEWKGLLGALEAKGIKFSFYELEEAFGLHPVVCVVRGAGYATSFGSLVGMGCSREKSVAAEKSLHEVMKNVMAIVELGKVEAISLEQFFAKAEIYPELHQSLALHHEYSKKIEALFSRIIAVPQRVLSDGLLIEALPLPPALAASPFVVMRAQHPDMQKLFFGPTTKEKLNWSRLTNFAGRSMEYKDIQWLPHPLG